MAKHLRLFSWHIFHMSVWDYFRLFGFVFWQTEKDKFQYESREKIHCLLCVNHTVIWQKAVACPCLGETILNLAVCVPCSLEYPLLPPPRKLCGIQLSCKTQKIAGYTCSGETQAVLLNCKYFNKRNKVWAFPGNRRKLLKMMKTIDASNKQISSCWQGKTFSLSHWLKSMSNSAYACCGC